MKKCNTCPFLQITEKVKSSRTNFVVKIENVVSCETINVVYCISYSKPSCNNIQYIGETGRRLGDRFREHIRYVESENQSQPTGYTLSSMKVTILDKC